MKVLFCAVAIAVCLSGQAQASVCQDGTGPARFCAADSNHDDALSQEEFSAAFPDIQPKAFSIIDANSDQKIDLSEWQSFMGNHEAKSPMPAMPGAEPKPRLIEPPKDSAVMPKDRP